MKKYYIFDGKEQKGPFDLEELKNLSITTNTLVWFEGMTEWAEIQKVPELKEIINSKLPPPVNSLPHTQNKLSIPPNSQNIFSSKKENIQNKKNKNTATIIILSFLGMMLFILIITTLISNNEKRKKEKIAVAKENAERDAKEYALKRELQAMQKAQENKKRLLRNRWENYISLKKNYNTSIFGGISDLYITLKNDMEYKLDYVEVEVSYIKSNGQLYKTETIIFNGVSRYDKVIKKAPDSDRGTEVRTRFVTIKAKEFDFCYDSNHLIDGPIYNLEEMDVFRCSN